MKSFVFVFMHDFKLFICAAFFAIIGAESNK